MKTYQYRNSPHSLNTGLIEKWLQKGVLHVELELCSKEFSLREQCISGDTNYAGNAIKTPRASPYLKARQWMNGSCQSFDNTPLSSHRGQRAFHHLVKFW